MFRTVTTLLAFAIVACCALRASASLLFSDSFNYNTGSLSANAGPTWQKPSAQAANTDPNVQTTIGGLSYTGLTPVGTDTTHALKYTGVGLGGTSEVSLGSTFTTGTVYYSLLLKVTAIQSSGGDGFSASSNNLTGSFSAGLSTTTQTGAIAAGSSAAALMIRTGDPTNASGNAQFFPSFQLGTGRTATQNTTDRVYYTGQNYNPGDTLFLVFKYQFGATNATDSASLFINPTPGQSEPAPQVFTQTGSTLALNGAGIRTFFVRHNTVEPDEMYIDQLRIGTTWQNVTAPEPASIALFSLAAVGLMGTVRRLDRRSGSV